LIERGQCGSLLVGNCNALLAEFDDVKAGEHDKKRGEADE
jgi:hypothetical protein